MLEPVPVAAHDPARSWDFPHGSWGLNMKTMMALAAGAAFALLAGSNAALAGPTLDAVKARGHLECGVHLGLPGFSFADDKGVWTGLDVDLCRAVAAAVFGDATKVKYTPTSVQQRWAVLTSGQVDLLSRNSTITFSRDANLGINFKGINFYEGQTFIVRKKSNVKTVKDMDGATICVAAGSTEEKTVGDYFRENNMKVTIINFAKNDDAIAAYDTERCDAYTAGVGALAGQRAQAQAARRPRHPRRRRSRTTRRGRSCAMATTSGAISCSGC